MKHMSSVGNYTLNSMSAQPVAINSNGNQGRQASCFGVKEDNEPVPLLVFNFRI